jgi:two-component system cell cycle sensor histidine kinase/response regulator CckA
MHDSSRAHQKLSEENASLRQRIQDLERALAERGRTEESLAQASERLALAQRSAGAGIWDWDFASGQLTWSPELYQLFGLDVAAGATFDMWRAALHPEDRQAAEARISDAVRDRVRLANEYRVVLPNGAVRWISALGDTTYDEHGEARRMAGICLDITERKQVEEALGRSEARHKTILETAMDGFWVMDIEGRLLEVNATYCRMSGYSEQELLAKRVSDLEGTEALADTAAHIQKVMARGEDRFESRHVRKDGSVFDVEISVQFRTTDGGRMIAFLRDITERQQAETALQELKLTIGSHELHSALVEMASDGFWLLDKEFMTVFVNPAIEKMLGYTKEEMIGRSWYDFGDPAWVARAKELERRRVDGVAEPHQFLFIHKTGRRVLARIATTPLYDASGNFDGALGILSDITRQKEADEALKIRDMLNAIAGASGIGMTLINPDYTIAWYNDLLAQWFGALDQTRGRNCFEVFEGRDAVCLDCPSRVSFESGEVVAVERSSITTSVSAERIVALTTSPIRDADGKVIQVVEIVQDITVRKRAEEEKARMEAQLQQAQKMESVGRLAGGVAHDFNNMLGVILGHSEIVLDQVDPALPIHADLVEIRKAAERSADLTRQLLAFARKQIVTPRVLDLNETVASMLKMLERLIGEDIQLRWRPGAGLWPIEVDPSQIDQILANLCVNGRDAITDVGRIKIETANATFGADYCAHHEGAVPGQYVRLIVNDDGCGMDQATQVHLFEPFFTTKSLGRGTGLGLATVYGTVKQNNGFIDVDSEPGHGTTFAVYLPRYQGEVAPLPAERAAGPTRRGQETILLVEDEPAILAMTTRILREQGYTVLAAGTPGEALRRAREHPGEIHLLLTDVVMPEMNGRDLARNLMSFYPDLRRLFMSGYTADVIAHHGVQDPGVSFVQKPFPIKALAAKVREALDGD